MNKNNKEQQIILVSNYGFKYAKDLKLDVSFKEEIEEEILDIEYEDEIEVLY